MNCLIEPLEGRRMMSTTPAAIDVSLQDGTLKINNATSVTVTELLGTGASSPDSVTVMSSQISGNGIDGPFYGVTNIVINGTEAGDTVTLNDANIKALINTLGGKDTIFVTNIAPTTVTDPDLVTINAGNGKDAIVAQTDGTTGTIATVVLSKGTDSVEAPGV